MNTRNTPVAECPHGAAPPFVPTREELLYLAAYWTQFALREDLDRFYLGWYQAGGFRGAIGWHRVDEITAALGNDAVGPVVAQAKEQFGKTVDPELWRLFQNAHATTVTVAQPVVGVEEVRNLLVGLVEYHDALVHFFVPDCPVTREQVARAQSRDELMALAKVVAQDYGDCRGLAESILECAGEHSDIGDSLDHYMSEVEGLFPCRSCGGHVCHGVCDDCDLETDRTNALQGA